MRFDVDTNDIPNDFYRLTVEEWTDLARTGSGLWPVLKHTYGWRFVSAINKQTKLLQPCFVRTKYRSAKKSQLTEDNEGIIYFSSPESIGKYMQSKLFPRGLPKVIPNADVIHKQDMSRYGDKGDAF